MSRRRLIRKRVGTPAAVRRRGVVLVDLMLIGLSVAVLLGLMVSLARRVRADAANDLTQRLLADLQEALIDHSSWVGPLEVSPSLLESGSAISTDEAIANNRAIISILQGDRASSQRQLPRASDATDASGDATGKTAAATEAEANGKADAAAEAAAVAAANAAADAASVEAADLDLRQLLTYTDGTVRDAWGFPVIYLARGRSDVGSAPGDGPFFVSPGPDGDYLTREDNVYSYEVYSPAPGQAVGPGQSDA